jgi:uncharacterized membrane protein
MRPLHVSITEVIVMLDGAEGADKSVFVNLIARIGLVSQLDVYASLTLSPVAAEVFCEYFILTTLDVNDPESTTALVPNVPTNDHCHPVALPVKAGAVYR